jgi:small nuclear ribonucleoprotein (snRNP)-like protein
MKNAAGTSRNYDSPESRSERSLVCLIQSLVGKKATIELRTDIMVKGILISVDEWMNMTLNAVTTTRLDGRQESFEWMYLKGRNVRMFHLPRSLDPAASIEAHRLSIIETRMTQMKERLRYPLARIEKGMGDCTDYIVHEMGDRDLWLEQIEVEDEEEEGEKEEEQGEG